MELIRAVTGTQKSGILINKRILALTSPYARKISPQLLFWQEKFPVCAQALLTVPTQLSFLPSASRTKKEDPLWLAKQN
jgi:hypothetical protein